MGTPATRTTFDKRAFPGASGVPATVVNYGAAETIYSQGDACKTVMYLQKGKVQLSVLSKRGREATVGFVGPGQFFGESALTAQRLRAGSATATVPSTVVAIKKTPMLRLLHEQHTLSDRFITHLLSRNIRIEEDLTEHLFSSVEQRLARALLLMAHYGEPGSQQRMIPKISQQALAELIGATRARVRFFMNKFRRLGFIRFDHGLTINSSLLGVVLQN